jgi:predicted PurR-regulated permease PerM
MSRQFNDSIKQVGLILLIVFLFCLIVGELRYFVSSILGAFTLYLILRKPHRWLLNKGWKTTWTTSVLLAAAFLFLVLIVGGLVSLIYVKLRHFNPQLIFDGLYNIHDLIIEKWNYDIFSGEILKKAVATVGNVLPVILSTTGSVVANIFMMLFVLFFMLRQSVQFEKGIESALPLSQESIRLLKKEANSMILSNAIGIPLILLGQGLTAALAYWLLDAGDPIVWGLFTGVFGLIPMIGTAGIWAPLAINLFMGGHIWQGIVLIAFGASIIASVDNLVRMVFLKKKANIHPLVTLFGILLGIKLFGFWGIIFGPLVISVFLLLIKIYRKEFSPD